MEFKVAVITLSEFKTKYNKNSPKSTSNGSSYVRLTTQEKEQRSADRQYRANWRSSTKLPTAKSQRKADILNLYY